MTTPATPSPASSLSLADFGPFSALEQRAGGLQTGKVFLSEPLQATSCEISLNRLPAGHGYAFTHKHRRNEEIFVVVGGRGVFVADGQQRELREGSVVRVAPAVVRTMAAAADSPLDYICFQAPQGGMPYSFAEDAIPVSTTVPFAKTLPLPDPLRRFFAAQAAAAPAPGA